MRDRLAAIGRMAGGIAHEIRNPLTSIAGSVQVLAGISELNSDQQALVDIVLRESDRLNAIITDFLLYAREKTYKMAAIDLVPLLDDTLTALEQKPSRPVVEIIRNFAAESAWTLADRDRIKQVFDILTKNALSAMPDGGQMAVSISPANDHWYIRIADTGLGLTPQQVEKVFEPFQPELNGGTGLGLAIVYQTLQAHDARISVHSAIGEGIEFSIELKRSDPPAQRAAGLLAEPADSNGSQAPAALPQSPNEVPHG